MNSTFLRVVSLVGLLIGSLLAVASPAAQSTDRQALDAAIHRWTAAVNAGDAVALRATMTDDVELSDAVATARGRDAAIRMLLDMGADGTLGAVTRELTISGNVAWHVIGLTETLKNGDVQGRGLALEIWKRVDGGWRLHRRMATGAPAVTLTRPSTREPVLDRPKN